MGQPHRETLPYAQLAERTLSTICAMTSKILGVVSD